MLYDAKKVDLPKELYDSIEKLYSCEKKLINHYVAIADTDLCTNQGFKSFVPSMDIKSEYLYQLLKMMKPKIQLKIKKILLQMKKQKILLMNPKMKIVRLHIQSLA